MTREPHPSFIQPVDKGVKIWRYMSLPKFLSLLQSKTLFFSRLNYFEDAFEGSLPLATIKQREGFLYSPELQTSFSEEELEERKKTFLDMLSEQTKKLRHEFMVNCWHMSSYESAAMWRLYSRGEPILSIQSTYEDLDKVLPPYVMLGGVRYIDYDSELIPYGNVLHPVTYKRKSFEHEKEIRAVVWQANLLAETRKHPEWNIEQLNITESGVAVPIDVKNLIKGVYVDPAASEWFADVVNKVCQENGLGELVHKSSLAKAPLF
jgi:hypothetical protein